jgi:hypothetical protein
MPKEYTVIATLTVAFGYEDEKPDEDQAKETFLEWLGSSSDSFILEGTTIEFEEYEVEYE